MSGLPIATAAKKHWFGFKTVLMITSLIKAKILEKLDNLLQIYFSFSDFFNEIRKTTINKIDEIIAAIEIV